MLRIRNISLPVDAGPEALRAAAARLLGVPAGALDRLVIARQSIDARKKQDLRYIYTVDVSLPNQRQIRLQPGKIESWNPAPYRFPQNKRTSSLPPVVVGMGPAGLFAALYLARGGIPCIVLERGQDVDARTRDVERFWETGLLTPSSNVQFGEGGAGTFSDGKLTTGTHDPRIRTVLDTLIAAGAPEDVRWSHKPHIGTDLLRQVVKNLRLELLQLGCEVRFGHRLTGLEHTGDRLTGIQVQGPAELYSLPCDTLVLAPGHSARDTFFMLREAGVPLQAKPFAVGVRIEHLQNEISRAQYGPGWSKLPPCDYKLACHLPGGRSVFTFCVCPGGRVVAAASEPGGLVTNGMSFRARDGANCNGGLLATVGPEDFPGDDPLAGVRFQQRWERAAFQAGGGDFRAPAQLAGDFLRKNPSRGPGRIVPTYRPGVAWTDLTGCLPEDVLASLREALPLLDRKVRGFAAPDSVLTGVETRSSSPVRIVRDRETLQSALGGLYPCGEGAGYAGGIVSAAVDGVRAAEAIARAD